MHEFEIIADYFVALTMGREECAGLQDDAAVLKIPEGYELVVSSDTLNAGTHFMKDEAPEISRGRRCGSVFRTLRPAGRSRFPITLRSHNRSGRRRAG